MKSAMTSVLNYDTYTSDEMKRDPDAVLGKIIEKQSGGIIKSNSGEHVAMIPASWLSILDGDDFQTILFAATEYALGRHSYMPEVVSRFITKHIRLLDEQGTTLLIEAIKRHMQVWGSQQPFPELWINLKDQLEQRLDEIKEGVA